MKNHHIFIYIYSPYYAIIKHMCHNSTRSRMITQLPANSSGTANKYHYVVSVVCMSYMCLKEFPCHDQRVTYSLSSNKVAACIQVLLKWTIITGKESPKPGIFLLHANLNTSFTKGLCPLEGEGSRYLEVGQETSIPKILPPNQMPHHPGSCSKNVGNSTSK